MEHKKVGIIGGGAWGTGLAQALARGNHKVEIWALEDDVVASIIPPSAASSPTIMSTKTNAFFQVLSLILQLPVQMILSRLQQIRNLSLLHLHHFSWLLQ